MSSEDEDNVPPATEASPSPEWLLAWGTCPPLYLSYGVVSKKGRRPALTDAVKAVQWFTALSPPLGLDYFGVFDGHFGAAVAEYLKTRLDGAIAEQIERELHTGTPRFHESCDGDVVGWWRTTIQDAFRAVDEEVVSGVVAGEAALVGATALIALVLERYIVLANCGASRVVISRGGEAVQLTTVHRPNRPDEKQRVETAGGRVIESTCTIDDVLPTSRALGSWLYKSYVTAEPEVKTVKREPRDEFLILATDGLWDTVTPAAACSFVQRRLRSARITMPWEPRMDSRGSPTVLAKEMVDHAIRAGSKDNVSVVLILFRKFWDERRPTTTK